MPIESLLTQDLERYIAGIKAGEVDLATLVRDSGLACARCGDGRCARRHAVRYRRRIRDLERGESHENVPIVRVRFCDRHTVSLVPAAIWRGRSTISSVLLAVHRAAREGVDATLGWATRRDVAGEEPIAERTLRRWRRLVSSRLLGEPCRWLATQGVTFEPDGIADPSTLAADTRLAFRASFGRGLLDTVTWPRLRPRTAAPRVRGRLDPASSPDPPPSWLPRGTRSARCRRGPPARGDPQGGDR